MLSIARGDQNPKHESIKGRVIDQAIAKASSTGRNNAGFWLACQLRDNGHTQSEAESAAEVYAASVGDRAYTRKEAISSVRSAFKRPAREPWGSGSHSGFFARRPELAKAQSVARFRQEEFRRLMDEAKDRAQAERAARERGRELTQSFDFNSPDWEVIDQFCLADQEADELLAVADWVANEATPDELEEYRAEVSR